MSVDQPKGLDDWTVFNHDSGNARHMGNRDKAHNIAGQFKTDGANIEVFEPGELPDALMNDDDRDNEDDTPDDEPEPEPDAHSEDGEDVHAEVIDHTTDTTPEPDAQHEPEAIPPEEIERKADALDDRDVGTDPLKWMPGEFVDSIDGSQCINRKGFEVLRYFYDVDLDMEMEIDPADNDMTHCRYKCTAAMDGSTVEAWGTSHVDRGDDPWLLVEMAATRSRKRAISVATGAGAVAVAELQNEVE